MKKKEEIIIENEDHIATFILNNGNDYDICQLFEKNKQYDKVAYIKSWISQDCFSTHMKNKDKIIADLKTQLAAKEVYKPSITADDVKKALAEPSSTSETIVNEIKKSHMWISKEYDDLKAAIEFYRTLEDKSVIDYKYRLSDGIDILRDRHTKQLKENDELKQRIEELEHENKILNAYIRHLILTIHNQKEKLENAIAIPKYKIGQEMWRSWSSVRAIREPIDTIHIYKDGQIGYEFADCLDVFMEDELFWTEEEAKKAWEEKQNGRT